MTGMSPSEMANRIVSNSERGFTVTVNDIEHQESQSLNGIAVIKIFFRPGVNLPMAVTQVTAMCQTMLRGLPPGTTPPLVITYSASTTPIVQLGLSSKTLPEERVFDLAQNFLRTQLTTVQGAATPYPYGGKPRQIQVDLDSAKLQAYGLAPARYRQRGVGAEPDSAGRHDQDRADRVPGGDERHPGYHRRTERSSGEVVEFVHALPARCGACARWICGANQHRAAGRRARRADVDV